MFDVYRNTKDPSLRMAVLPGAGLPTHLDALEKHLHRTKLGTDARGLIGTV